MGITEALNNLNMSVNPQGAELKNSINNQQMMRGALQSMAQQMQQPGEDGQPQMNPAMMKYAMMLNQIAQANPSADNVNSAAQTQSPYYSAMMKMGMQQKEAEIAQKESEAIKNSIVDTPTGKVLVNTKTGEQIPIGNHIYASPEVQKLHDLNNFAKKQTAEMPPAADASSQPQPSIPSGINDQLIAGMSADPAGRAKSMQEADQSVIDTKAARDLMLPSLNHMDLINDSGDLPSVAPEEIAAGSTMLQAAGMTNGEKANAVNTFQQLNSGNFTKGLSSFFSSGNGMRMEKAIADAVSISNSIPLSVPPEARKKMINQLRISAYNATIAAQNKAAQLRNPTAPVTPELPMNFKGKIHTMQEVMETAAKHKQDPSQVIDFIKKQGGLVAQ